MEKLKCQRCNHEWLPRVEEVKECPKCKSRNWNVLKKPQFITASFWDSITKELEKKNEKPI